MKQWKLRTAALAVALSLMTVQVPVAEAGLQDKLNSIFNDMANVSNPGAFETARRGVVSGGSAYVRSPIVRTRLVDLQPPSVSAGCGGISFFGGSFSFINADQFVALLRAVAANAKGYAFQLALDVACPSCKQLIDSLQSKIQELNSTLGDSCKMAKWLMDESGASSAIKTATTQLSSTVNGYFSDFFGASSQEEGKSSNVVTTQKDEETTKKITGNLIYKQLSKNNSVNWIRGSVGTAQEEYELIQSITGTVIVTPPPASDGDNTKSDQYGFEWIDSKVSLIDLIEGRTDHTINGCATVTDGDCPEINDQKTLTFKGLRPLILGYLNGEGDSVGLIAKFAMYKGNAPTDNEKAIFQNFPAGSLAMIQLIAQTSPTFARSKAQDIAEALALEMADQQLESAIKTARQAISNSESSDTKDVLKKLDQAQQTIYQDYQKYAKSHVTLAKLYQELQSALSGMDKIKVSVNGQSRPSANTNTTTDQAGG